MKLPELASSVEKGFNVANTLPLINLVTIPLRSASGQIQALAAAVLGSLCYVIQAFVIKDYAAKWNQRAIQCMEHVIHGTLNMVRSFGEMVAALTIIGSIALLAWQCLSKNGFNPIYKYGQGFAPISDIKPNIDIAPPQATAS